MLYKQEDGRYRWVARYSNNFRDDDNPPEIIAEKSHRRFVELVDKGEAPMPELWLWHVKEWRWGVADFVAWDDEGFAVASGTVDEGKENVAETMMVIPPESLRVSHGMPKDSIVRDDDDPSVIVQHTSKEISPLPAGAAANKLTDFTILKEGTMAIPQGKKDELVELGLSADLLEQLEAANVADAKEAEESGIEHKETDGETGPAVEASEPTTEEAPAEPAPVAREEMAGVLTQIGEAIQGLNAQIEALAGEVKAIKEEKEVEEEHTLADLFKRAVGHEDAREDGRSKLAKSKPKETEPAEQKTISGVTNPLLAPVIDNILTGDWVEPFRPEKPS